MSSLLMAICRGDVLLWVGERDGEPCMALITQIVDYPGKRALSIPFMGGKGGFEWGDELLTCLEQHAADRECALIEAVGRRGLGPFLNERGYRNSYITFTKEL